MPIVRNKVKFGFLANSKVSTRLFIGFTLMILFIVGVGVFSIWQMLSLSQLTTKLYNHPYTVSNAVLNVHIDVLKIRDNIKDIALAQDNVQLSTIVNEIETLELLIRSDLAVLQERFLGDKQEIDELTKQLEQWKAIRSQIIALAQQGKYQEAAYEIREGRGKQHVTKVYEGIKKVSEFAGNKAVEFMKNANLQAEKSTQWAVILIIVVTVTGSWIGMSISRAINKPLSSAVILANEIADGNLRSNQTEIAGNNEIINLLQALDKMAEKLREIIATIKQTSNTIGIAAEEISQGNLSLSQRTEEQAASLEQTAASMEQMTGTVEQNADNTKQATQLAVSARDRAEQGGKVVHAAIMAMNEISKSSKKVADIISVINDIAFQTNLLALNAAVEAARAGEQGRGFAVVASEVRNLAQRSATAAKEIKELIQDSVSKVEEGTRLVNESGTTLEEIVKAVKKVSDIIAEIAAASTEQTSSIHQVNKAVTQMDEMTQQNAALVEQSAAASESMNEQAQRLNQHVAFFRLDETEPVKQADEKKPGSKPPSTRQKSKEVERDKLDKGDWKEF